MITPATDQLDSPDPPKPRSETCQIVFARVPVVAARFLSKAQPILVALHTFQVILQHSLPIACRSCPMACWILDKHPS